MKLSIVIPAYQEEQRLGRTFDELDHACNRLGIRPEVIVVDDGSTDATVEVAEGCVDRYPDSYVISDPANRGKGYAVRTGMLEATGDLRLFMDADGSTAMAEIGRFLQLAEEVDIVIASIGMKGANVLRYQPFPRSLAGRTANALIRLLAVPGIKDTQRGFKLFTAEAAEDVFSRSSIDGWAFDVEVLAIAHRLGYLVREVPVTWEHREDSRVRAGSYVSTFKDLLRIRWKLWRGRYSRTHR
ncbi:MAG: dolichyl-phosphate beta-glucosyltransferase [Acidimicrobiia bacterium]